MKILKLNNCNYKKTFKTNDRNKIKKRIRLFGKKNGFNGFIEEEKNIFIFTGGKFHLVGYLEELE